MNFRIVLVVLAGFLIAAEEPGKAKILETITVLEKEGWEALKKGDAETLKAVIADDFVAIFADGTVVNRDAFVKLLADFKVNSYKLNDVNMVLFNNDAAILTFKITYESVVGGKTTQNENVQASSGYARRKGKWVNVFYQETPGKK